MKPAQNTIHSFNTIPQLPLWLMFLEYIVLMAAVSPIFDKIEEAEAFTGTVLYIGLLIVVAGIFVFLNKRFTQYFYKGCGLFFTDEALIYHPSRFIYAEVKWKDIRSLQTSKQTFTSYLLPMFNNPGQVVEEQTNAFGKFQLARRLKKFKTPIVLEPNKFGSSHYQLKTLIDEFAKLNKPFMMKVEKERSATH